MAESLQSASPVNPPVKDETLERMAREAEFNTSYLVLMATSGVLAAVALLTNSVPLLIGSMVVAPALNPLELVAFALVGRRFRLAGYGLIVSVAGLFLASGCAVLTTLVLNWTDVLPAGENLLNKHLLEERVQPQWYSAVAALAAGVAAVVARTKQKLDTLVGVVAALALVPAAAAAGIALLSRDPERSWGGLALLGINMGLIVLTGVATLLILRPDQRS